MLWARVLSPFDDDPSYTFRYPGLSILVAVSLEFFPSIYPNIVLW